MSDARIGLIVTVPLTCTAIAQVYCKLTAESEVVVTLA